ncbi:putative cell division topological specificity factor (chloroplast) [Chlorella vulgaris]|jgi:hypothetical protein
MVESNQTKKQKQFFEIKNALEALIEVHFYSDLGETPLIQYLDQFFSVYNRFFRFYLFTYGETIFFDEKNFFLYFKNNNFPAKTKNEILTSAKLHVFFTENDFSLLKTIWRFFNVQTNSDFLIKEFVDYRKLINQHIKTMEKDFSGSSVSTQTEDNWLYCFNLHSQMVLEFMVVRHCFLNFFHQIPKNSTFKEQIFQQLLIIDQCLLLLVFSQIEFKQNYQKFLEEQKKIKKA